jgi:hypothetical protein
LLPFAAKASLLRSGRPFICFLLCITWSGHSSRLTQKNHLIADHGLFDCNFDGVQAHSGERKFSNALQPSPNGAVPQGSRSAKKSYWAIAQV